MTAAAEKPSMPASVWNVPNTLSAARIVMAVVFFAAFEFHAYLIALVLYSLATATDWLDGYWARKYGQVTQLGRILDPFADKLLVCGAFVYLAATPEARVAPWMAVVVLSRELLVTALRSFVESSGGDFSAKWVGKWKMAAQCAVVIAALIMLQYPLPPPSWLVVVFGVLLWCAILLTVYSGVTYAMSAVSMARNVKD